MLNLKSIMNPANTERTTLEKIVSRVRSDETLRDIVSKIRDAKDKPERDEIKIKKLPAFTLHNFNGAVLNDNFVSTKYIIYDIDGLDPTQLSTARRAVQEFSVFYFTSPSGKGLKFVIEFDREMNLAEYRLNRSHNRKFLSDLLEQKLDESYNALHTFYSYDPTCVINAKHEIFQTISVDNALRSDEINPDPVSYSSSEIEAIAKHLQGRKLCYDQWMKLALSLQKVEKGKEIFMSIGRYDTDPDHSHRDWEKKWDSVGKANEITVGTFYSLAYQFGYRRSPVYQEDGKGGFNPFIVDENGMSYKPKEKPAVRCFGFKNIKILYQIFDPDNGNKTVLKVNDHEVKLPSQVFSSPGEFRKAVQSKVKGSPFMITSSKASTYYDMLFDYLDKTKSKVCVEIYPGVGKVSDDGNIWNFGSVVLIDNTIVPYESLIIVSGKGYVFDDNRHSLNIVYDDQALIRKLNLMHDFYTEDAATAIGWAVSNIFYDQITGHGMNFPHLFLFGDSSAGKTALAKIILSMFGVLANKATSFYLNIASGSTANAVGRVKAGVRGIPNFFDEYTHRGENDSKMYERLKALYDNQGKTMAKKTNNNEVHTMQPGGGTIFASVYRDNDPQAALRCCYIDLSGVKDNIQERLDLFDKEFVLPEGLQELSSIALNVAMSVTYEKWKSYHSRYLSMIRSEVKPGTESRITNNLAVAAAGYAVMKPFIKNPADDAWWSLSASHTQSMISASSEIEEFLSYCYQCAVEGKYSDFVTVEDNFKKDHVTLYINTPGMMRKAKHDRVEIPSDKSTINKKIKESDMFVCTKTFGKMKLYHHEINYVPK